MDVCGDELDLGTPIDATPSRARGGATSRRPGSARTRGRTGSCCAACSAGQGLVNYPTEWWHWSYGDRYWALVTGAPHAPYGPVVEAAGGMTGLAARDRARSGVPRLVDVDLAAVAANTACSRTARPAT